MTEARTTESILAERRGTHGDFTENARMAQQIMRVLETGPSWGDTTDVMRESLHMFAHKMARICGGDPTVQDHWNDVAGYARLVSQRLAAPGEAQEEQNTRDAEAHLAARDRHLPLTSGYIQSGRGRPPGPVLMPHENPHGAWGAPPLGEGGLLSGRVERQGTPEDGGHHAAEGLEETPGSQQLTPEAPAATPVASQPSRRPLEERLDGLVQPMFDLLHDEGLQMCTCRLPERARLQRAEALSLGDRVTQFYDVLLTFRDTAWGAPHDPSYGEAQPARSRLDAQREADDLRAEFMQSVLE